MCLLCIEVAKVNMTPREVARAYSEVSINDEHYSEILQVINEHYDFDVVGRELNKVYDEQD